ncbi:MAG: ABC transporter [Phycisphaeraceae bacterium]|nr:ABC transporter [Phycisphaeraceae bacterium]
MINVHELVKWYGPTLAVDQLTFEIEPGQIIGFLGPNGAGKSTTLRILTGFLPMTSGRASVAGYDLTTQSQQARSKIGYLPESTPLYGEMRVEEYLHYRGKLQGMDRRSRFDRINMVCDRCGLEQLRRRLIGQLSRGNRQRIGIAQALLHNPPILILDEPTAGLDPTQITHVRELIAELRGQHTIVLSTHILAEVEKSADRVMIIARGKVVAEGSPDELRRQVAAGSSVLIVEAKAAQEAAQKVITEIHGVQSITSKADDGWTQIRVTADGNIDVREPIGAAMLQNGWAIREMRHEIATLEQFFIEVTAQQDQAVA